MESAGLRLTAPIRLSGLMPDRIYLTEPPTELSPPLPIGGTAYPSASPHSLVTPHGWLPNVDGISIAYAFRPELRDRLTLGGLTFPRKP